MIVAFAQTTKKVDSKTEEALAALDSLYDKLKEQILRNDTNFNKSLTKFEDRYEKMKMSQNNSSLSCYGKMYLDSGRGKIKMQPTAASRSSTMEAGRSKIPAEKENESYAIEEHIIAKIVKFNKPSAKKYDRTMSSTTTYPTRKEKFLPTVTAKIDQETDE